MGLLAAAVIARRWTLGTASAEWIADSTYGADVPDPLRVAALPSFVH